MKDSTRAHWPGSVRFAPAHSLEVTLFVAISVSTTARTSQPGYLEPAGAVA
ncbi:hypothetical protein AnigIFM63309_005797 [Aspergillus niger]|uniref:Tetratricopeptide repeat family protein n=1 Tax=Aspergillus niger TaxID=5061 RepID=A0A505HRW1_ASPNG|nr:Tetratricopeptide repeat family protein [Aspergillus niger]GJP97287.1 tetratricopeptide repeat family protein [Aspergillus niger]GLA38500.1 hypothetical protein AnigIFM63309_005797 [Aspergillus niger]